MLQVLLLDLDLEKARVHINLLYEGTIHVDSNSLFTELLLAAGESTLQSEVLPASLAPTELKVDRTLTIVWKCV